MPRLRLAAVLAGLAAIIGAASRPATAQTDSNPVVWKATLDPTHARPGEGARVLLSATIKEPWHIYAPTTKPGGPIATTVTFTSSAAKWTGKIVEPPPLKHQDTGFNMEVETFAKGVTFGLPVTLGKSASGSATILVRYQACNDRMCLPPKKVSVPLTFKLASGAARPDHVKPVTTVPASVAQSADGGGTAVAASSGAELGSSAGVVQFGQGNNDSSLVPFLALALVSGFASLLTPCVFPMIPITVSLFAKRTEKGGSRWSGPIAYSAGIIGTFTLLGLLGSVVKQVVQVPNLAANPWFNLIMTLVFVAMGLNLLGAYQIIVPSTILSKVQPTGKQGIGVPLAMGFASTLTSFTCTAPFVGTMLFSAASGNVVRPALGMLVYSLAFASPFFLLAFFPSWLSKMPRAGEWLIAVKATMGFVELAAAIKFLQQADYTWQLGWLTRTGMLTVWFSIALVTALYLFRTIRLPHDSEGIKVGPTRRVLGTGFAALAAWFLAGSNGRDLGYFESYLPEASYGQSVVARTDWLEDDYSGALKRAREQNKPLLINFTGYACTNCRLMEKHVLPEKVVTSELGNFVPVFLHTDGTDTKSRENADLQQKMLGTVALPVYAVVTPEGTLKGRLDGLERDPGKFAAFLRESHAATRLARS